MPEIKTKLITHQYLYALFFLVDKYKDKGYKVEGNVEKINNLFKILMICEKQKTEK